MKYSKNNNTNSLLYQVAHIQTSVFFDKNKTKILFTSFMAISIFDVFETRHCGTEI